MLSEHFYFSINYIDIAFFIFQYIPWNYIPDFINIIRKTSFIIEF